MNTSKMFEVLISFALVLSVSGLASSCGRPDRSFMRAFQATSEDELRQKLKSVKSDIIAIDKSAHRADRARLFVIAQHVDSSINLMNTKGIVNGETQRSLVKLVMQFIYAEMFFQFVRTDTNSDLVDRVLETTINVNGPSIRKDIGYDDPRGSITADNLDVIRAGVQTLIETSDVPESDKLIYKPLLASLGHTIALARAQGDRPVAHCEGRKRCQEIDAIYTLLDKYTGTVQLFAVAQSIRGTNEFMKDYLQVELMKNTDNCSGN